MVEIVFFQVEHPVLYVHSDYYRKRNTTNNSTEYYETICSVLLMKTQVNMIKDIDSRSEK